MQYWWRDRHMDQWHRIENTENTQGYPTDGSAKVTKWRKNSL